MDSIHTRAVLSATGGAVALALGLPIASAGVILVDPFAGDRSETFNEYSSVNAVQSLPVFDGLGTLDNVTSGGAIKLEFSSSLNGDLVRPISGMMAGQLGIGEWHFPLGVRRFGGYWENNSGASDATVSFYDSAGGLIETATATVPVAAQHWTWNGWESDTPIAEVRVVGNGLINGFIWYENMVVTVPEPGAAGLAFGAIWLAHSVVRRRNRA